LCAVAAGVSTAITGSGSLADPWTIALSLSTDADQLAVISAGKLLVPGAGPRSSFTGGVSAVQSTTAITISSASGKYKKRGRQVNGWMNVLFGSTGVAANDLTLTIGSIPVPSPFGVPVGTAQYVKTSATARVYEGFIYYIGSGIYKVMVDSGTSTSQYLGQNPSFATVANDQLTCLFDYETAS